MTWEKNPGTYVKRGEGPGGDSNPAKPDEARLLHVWRNTENGHYLTVAQYHSSGGGNVRWAVVLYPDQKIGSPEGLLDKVQAYFRDDVLNAKDGIRLIKNCTDNRAALHKAETLIENDRVYDYY